MWKTKREKHWILLKIYVNWKSVYTSNQGGGVGGAELSTIIHPGDAIDFGGFFLRTKKRAFVTVCRNESPVSMVGI